MESKSVRHKYMIYLKDPSILEWVNKKIEEGEFRNLSHAVEYCLKKVKAWMDEREVLEIKT